MIITIFAFFGSNFEVRIDSELVMLANCYNLLN
jgi:hypothetical protein